MADTYRVFTHRGDKDLTLEGVQELVQRGEIKPTTRVYNTETKNWVDYKDYRLLHKRLASLPNTQPKEEAQDTYKVLLNGASHSYHNMSLYLIERLFKNGTIKSDTQIYKNSTNSWVKFQEHTGLQRQLSTFDSDTPSANDKASNNPHLKPCPQCQHSCSTRATKCPSCGASLTGSPCLICKSIIPESSSSCPKCGDPEPFGKKKVAQTVEPPRNVNHSIKEPSPQVELKDSNNKQARPLLRWTLIVAGTILSTIIVAVIQDIQTGGVQTGRTNLPLVLTPVFSWLILLFLSRSMIKGGSYNNVNGNDTPPIESSSAESGHDGPLFIRKKTINQSDDSERFFPKNKSSKGGRTGCLIVAGLFFPLILVFTLIMLIAGV